MKLWTDADYRICRIFYMISILFVLAHKNPFYLVYKMQNRSLDLLLLNFYFHFHLNDNYMMIDISCSMIIKFDDVL